MHLVNPLVPFKLLGVRVGEFLPALWDDHFLPQSFNLIILILRHNYNVIIGQKINQIFLSFLFLFNIWLPDLPQLKSPWTYYALSVEVFPFICFKFSHCSFHWEHTCSHIVKWGKENNKRRRISTTPLKCENVYSCLPVILKLFTFVISLSRGPTLHWLQPVGPWLTLQSKILCQLLHCTLCKLHLTIFQSDFFAKMAKRFHSKGWCPSVAVVTKI